MGTPGFPEPGTQLPLPARAARQVVQTDPWAGASARGAVCTEGLSVCVLFPYLHYSLVDSKGRCVYYEKCLLNGSEVPCFTESVHCTSCGAGGRGLRWAGSLGGLPSGFMSLPFLLQFFLFILIIFLAELSAAILAFIFRENVRTGPHTLAPCHQPGVGGHHGQPVPS